MSLARIDEKLKIISVEAKDMRWPTSLGGHGSDAMVRAIILCIDIQFSVYSVKSLLKKNSIHSTLIPIIHVHM